MVDNVQQIKDKLDIVDVISGYLKLTKAGVNFKARCPFHNEKTPSFFVTPERQIWHCFGCSKGGDMFGFVQDIEGVDFPEALRILAQRAGVQLEYSSNFAAKDDKAVLYDICETAARFFEKQLHNSSGGKRALEYLKNRGLAEETIQEFRLGFAPAEWDSLSVFLRNCGHKDNEIVEAGMAIKRDGGNGVYDRFRSRIIFPIADLNGQTVGFTGRIFDFKDARGSTQIGTQINAEKEVAKYINTPQTLIYDKSKILYGLNKARTEIRREDKCVMVEGNMDAIMSYQAGVKNVVATSGTALTPFHLKIVQRYTPNLGFCFDTDQAGAMATRRGIGLALAGGLNVKVVEIKDPAPSLSADRQSASSADEGRAWGGAGNECKDPADFIQRYGSKWVEAVSDAKPVMEFYFDKAKEDFDPNSAESKKTVISILAPFVKRLASQVERTHWVSQLAFFLRAKDSDVEADLAAAKDDLPTEFLDGLKHRQETTPRVPLPESVPAAVVPAPDKEEDIDILSEALLSVVMKKPALFKEDLKTINSALLDVHTAGIIAKMAAAESTDFAGLLKEFREKEQSPDSRAIEDPRQSRDYKLEFAYLKSQELWKDFGDDDLKSEFKNLIDKIKKRSISAQLTGLVYDIQQAEVKKDKEKVKELSVRFAELINEFPQSS